MHRWLGPYQVTHRIKENTYRLRRIDTSSQTVAHISQIKKIPGSSMPTLPLAVGSKVTQSMVSPSSVSHEIATQQEQKESKEEEKQSKQEETQLK